MVWALTSDWVPPCCGCRFRVSIGRASLAANIAAEGVRQPGRERPSLRDVVRFEIGRRYVHAEIALPVLALGA
jgi:hypothetical protein